MSLTLYLVRHGEYEGNLDRTTLTGRSDTRPLNPTGIVEARNVGRFFLDHNIQAILSSPVARALQTASIIGGEIGMTPVVDERLTELSYGELEGKTFAQIEKKFGHLRKDWENGDRYTLKAPGGESFAELRKRIEVCLQEIVQQYKGKDGKIIIVTHHAVIHTLLLHAMGRDPRDILTIEKEMPIPNTSVTKLLMGEDGKIEIKYIGKSFAYPPKIIRNWLKNRFKGLSDLHLYTGFSRSFVLSFVYGAQTLNMKFYVPGDVAVAEKITAISHYAQHRLVPLPIPHILERVATTIPAFPLALVRAHIPAEAISFVTLREEKKLPERAAQILQMVHSIPIGEVVSFWQSQEYPVSVHDTATWRQMLTYITHERLTGASRLADQSLTRLVLDITAWIKRHESEIAQDDIVPLHGDYYPANWCIQNGDITALIDFDLALVGHRLWDLGIGRQRAETFLYPEFARRMEDAYGVGGDEKRWVYCYTLLEFIGSYINNVETKSFQQHFDLRMIGKYKELLFS